MYYIGEEWGLLCPLIYVPTREVTCITLSRKKKKKKKYSKPTTLSHTNPEWLKYFKIKRILEESHTSILEPNGNMENWIKKLINKSNNKVSQKKKKKNPTIRCEPRSLFLFLRVVMCDFVREEGTRVTCPRFHSVNYLSIVINQLIIMTNQNILQLVLIILTNQIKGGRSGRFATHHAPNGTNFHTTFFYHTSCVPYWKRCANLILHRKIFYRSKYFFATIFVIPK